VSLVDAALALALEAHQVEASRIEDVRPTVDVRQYLHPKQLEVFECDARVINVLGGRQGGKTFVDVGWLIEGGFERPGTPNPYFALSNRSLSDIMWPEVIAWWNLLGLPHAGLHAHNYTAVLPNGSVIKGMGTDDSKTIETIGRGPKYNRIVVDEMGAQPKSFIEYFISMMWPTMLKNRGRMLRSGNPGLTLEGYWYSQTGPHRSTDVPLFHWTAWDNPSLGSLEQIEAFIEEFLRDAGLDRESVTFRREWLAEWIEDQGAIVFPFEACEGQRNWAPAVLPTRTINGVAIPESGWRRCLGADVGMVDACAFAVLASHPLLPDDYIIHVEKHVGMITEQFRNRMRELKVEFKPTRVPRVDTEGMGKAYAEDCMRHGVGVVAAEKKDKKAFVRLFRDRIIAGRVKAQEGKCIPLLDEAAAVGWDKKRELPIEGLPDDAIHACLYTWRDLHNYRDTDAPRLMTQAEQLSAEEQGWIDARLKQSNRSHHYLDRSRAAHARR
jgi:hypothetical protein